jgi:hypothetical protein
LTITSFGRIDGLEDLETIPTWMLSKDERNRVKQRQPIQPVGDAGDMMDEGDGGEQVAGEEPAPSRRDPTGRHDSRRLAGGKPPTTGAD